MRKEETEVKFVDDILYFKPNAIQIATGKICDYKQRLAERER